MRDISLGKLTAVFRNWARRVSPRLFVQCLVFVPLFVATVSLFELPVEYYSGYALEHRFDLSTQSLDSWFGDWGKGLALNMFLAIFLVWGLYWIIRRSPHHWWFYSWLASIPVALSLIFVEPLVVAPLFFQFTRLDRNQPVLTSRIEAMLGQAGLEIPASRIFEMGASTKTRAINAYVTGIGASKRVVIYDNTTQKLDGDATLLVLGHETGHYVLGHILKGFVLFEVGALAALFLGFIAFRRIVRSLGFRTGIEGEGDVASLPIMLLIITVLGFLVSPISCALSRYFEHQADQFGLEVTYGVVADPNVAAVRSFQILGEEDLEDPDPSPLIKLWLYTHPPLDERIRFAASYKPWSEGKPLEFVRPR